MPNNVTKTLDVIAPVTTSRLAFSFVSLSNSSQSTLSAFGSPSLFRSPMAAFLQLFEQQRHEFPYCLHVPEFCLIELLPERFLAAIEDFYGPHAVDTQLLTNQNIIFQLGLFYFGNAR